MYLIIVRNTIDALLRQWAYHEFKIGLIQFYVLFRLTKMKEPFVFMEWNVFKHLPEDTEEALNIW